MEKFIRRLLIFTLLVIGFVVLVDQALAKQPTTPPQLPPDFASWEKIVDTSCIAKEGKTMRGVVHVNKSEFMTLVRVFLNQDFLAESLFSSAGKSIERAVMKIQFPQGQWTLYQSDIDTNVEMNEAVLEALGLTEKEYIECLEHAK